MLHIGFTGTRHGMTEQQLAMMPHSSSWTTSSFERRMSLPIYRPDR